MTPLKPAPRGKGIKRAIPRPIVGRDWVIELDAVELRIREKRRRTVYALPWDFIVQAAAKRAADDLEKLRKAARAERRSAR